MVRNLFFAALAVALLAGIGYANQSASSKVVIPVSKTSATNGKQMYMNYCAPCHGVDGRGQGPVAAALKKHPANLALLSKNDRGKFPPLVYVGTELARPTRLTERPKNARLGPNAWQDRFFDQRRPNGVLRISNLIQLRIAVRCRRDRSPRHLLPF